MKKMPLLIASVMLVAIMSAFTTKQPTDLFYRVGENDFRKIEGPGTCPPNVYHCQYEWIGEGEPGSTDEESDYLPIGDPNEIFVPNP